MSLRVRVYLPGSSEDGETHGESDADVEPSVGADAVEEVLPSLVVALQAHWGEVQVFCHSIYIFY